ncbi:PFDN5 isoform 1 [Pan troglodytes]|uniref:Prefoldin subunit 5 n=18 Tax=Euarchontoglires TaxID=314146 RepID=H3BMQ1_HUMAN|nr:prefoldin subunit 5 [Homo sapiens]KAI4066191.1 prefoldin subunit 5 [Homo sapiens]PNI32942.1 PFDN5 isoform 1 [Pan troglodytes]PNJ25377.1 PFDN5 isoform 1 [Pongo abelii]
MAQSINITELNLPQLEMLKNQLDQTAEDAKDFFKRKIDFLTKQMEKIQPALQEKHAMKQAVMEMMSQKIQQLTALGAAQATAKA